MTDEPPYEEGLLAVEYALAMAEWRDKSDVLLVIGRGMQHTDAERGIPPYDWESVVFAVRDERLAYLECARLAKRHAELLREAHATRSDASQGGGVP